MVQVGRGPILDLDGETVTADLSVSLGRVVETTADDPVVAGRDHRENGAWLSDALSVGSRETGTDVVVIGRVAAPTLARSLPWFDGSFGVMVTGGDNPPVLDEFRFWTGSGKPLPRCLACRLRRGPGYDDRRRPS